MTMVTVTRTARHTDEKPDFDIRVHESKAETHSSSRLNYLCHAIYFNEELYPFSSSELEFLRGSMAADRVEVKGIHPAYLIDRIQSVRGLSSIQVSHDLEVIRERLGDSGLADDPEAMEILTTLCTEMMPTVLLGGEPIPILKADTDEVSKMIRAISTTIKESEEAEKKPETKAAPMKFDSWAAYEKVFAHPSVRAAYVWGRKGMGKSYTAMRYGLNGRKAYAVTLTPETPAAELRGHFVPKGSEFVWQDGVIVRAMREGARLVVNELSHASEDVMAILYPVLESKETSEITLPSLEVVVPKDGFQVICTDNFSPSQLPDALRDRFNVIIEVKDIHPAALDRVRPELRKLAEDSSHLDGDRFISIRSWLSYQELEADFGDEFAANAVFGPDRGPNMLTAIRMREHADPKLMK